MPKRIRGLFGPRINRVVVDELDSDHEPEPLNVQAPVPWDHPDANPMRDLAVAAEAYQHVNEIDFNEVADAVDDVAEGIRNVRDAATNAVLTFDGINQWNEVAMPAATRAGDIVYANGITSWTLPSSVTVTTHNWGTGYSSEPAEGTVAYQNLKNARAQIAALKQDLAASLDIPIGLLR